MTQGLFSTSSVIRQCGISTRQLYYWELTGLIRPQYESFGSRQFRRYTAEHIHVLKRAKALLDQGFTLQAVREGLKPGEALENGEEISKGDAA